MSIDLNERDRRILEAVIQDYIRTAEPVGSRTLSKRYGLELSPATIRNVMADLDELGFLFQPHTSAGRIPTQQALRYYVDSILEIKDLPMVDQEAIYQEFAGLDPELQQVMKRCSKVLSSVSRQVSVVSAPKFSSNVLRQLQFIRLGQKSILAILVGKTGLIQNRIIEIEDDLAQETLDGFNRYLNDILEGLSIREIKVRIIEEMRQEKNRFDRMLSSALTLSQRVFERDDVEDEIFVDGRVNLLDWSEMVGVDNMKALFKAFEDKSILVGLLDNTMSASGVQIFIGAETEMAALEPCTLIASRYSRGARPLGTLGVIGPNSMNYSKIIPVVDYTAKLVSNILNKVS